MLINVSLKNSDLRVYGWVPKPSSLKGPVFFTVHFQTVSNSDTARFFRVNYVETIPSMATVEVLPSRPFYLIMRNYSNYLVNLRALSERMLSAFPTPTPASDNYRIIRSVDNKITWLYDRDGDLVIDLSLGTNVPFIVDVNTSCLHILSNNSGGMLRLEDIPLICEQDCEKIICLYKNFIKCIR